MPRQRTTIYLGMQTRRLAAAMSPDTPNLSREIEWAVDGYLLIVEDALPVFRLPEWVAVVAALSEVDSSRPNQARFLGDELVRANKLGVGKDLGVDLGTIGYRLGASPLPTLLAVLHIVRSCRGLTSDRIERRLLELLPSKALKA